MPPSIIKEVSPSSVMCEKQTLCLVSCQATSYIPLNYSWTKDGQVPTGDGIKLMNNSIVVTPRNAQDYGQYVCHASNNFGSTKYKITLLAPKDTRCNDGKYSSSNSNALKIFRLTKFGKPSTLRSELAFSELLMITVCTGLIILVSKAKLCGGLRSQRCLV